MSGSSSADKEVWFIDEINNKLVEKDLLPLLKKYSFYFPEITIGDNIGPIDILVITEKLIVANIGKEDKKKNLYDIHQNNKARILGILEKIDLGFLTLTELQSVIVNSFLTEMPNEVRELATAKFEEAKSMWPIIATLDMSDFEYLKNVNVAFQKIETFLGGLNLPGEKSNTN